MKFDTYKGLNNKRKKKQEKSDSMSETGFLFPPRGFKARLDMVDGVFIR